MTAHETRPAAHPAAAAPRALVPIVTLSMGLSMVVLYAIGALGPFLVDDLDIPPYRLGLLTAVTFGAATVLSLGAGHVTDLIGGRRALATLLVLVAVDFALLAATPGYAFLLVALVLAGVPQALANPATNSLIAQHVPPPQRPFAVGVKQSGVPLAALLTGLLLPSLARASSWRWALAVIVPVAAVAALLVLLVPRGRRPEKPAGFSLPAPPNAPAALLMANSLCVGCGLSALSTYLPLYAHQELSMGTGTAGGLIAAMGVAGIAARVLWAKYSDRLGDIPTSLYGFALASAVFGSLVPAATGARWLIWPAALGLGCTAAVAQAITMVAVTKGHGFGRTGHASALVSMGFFGGFVVGPLGFGLINEATDGFTVGWAVVVALFVVAAVVAWGGRRTIRDCTR